MYKIFFILPAILNSMRTFVLFFLRILARVERTETETKKVCENNKLSAGLMSKLFVGIRVTTRVSVTRPGDIVGVSGNFAIAK